MSERRILKSRDIRSGVNDAIAHCNAAIEQFESYLEVANTQTQIAIIDNDVIKTAGEIVVYGLQLALNISDEDVKHVSHEDVGKVLFQEYLISNYMPFIKNSGSLAMPLVMLADQIPEFKTLLLDRVPEMEIYPEITNITADALADYRFNELNRRILCRGMQHANRFIDSVLSSNHFIEHIANTHVLAIAKTKGMHSIVSLGDMMALEYMKLAHGLADYTLTNSDIHEINIPEIINEVNHTHLKSLINKIISVKTRRQKRHITRSQEELYFMPVKPKYEPMWYGKDPED